MVLAFVESRQPSCVFYLRELSIQLSEAPRDETRRCWRCGGYGSKRKKHFISTDLERWLWLVVIHFNPLHFHDYFSGLLSLFSVGLILIISCYRGGSCARNFVPFNLSAPEKIPKNLWLSIYDRSFLVYARTFTYANSQRNWLKTFHVLFAQHCWYWLSVRLTAISSSPTKPRDVITAANVLLLLFHW